MPIGARFSRGPQSSRSAERGVAARGSCCASPSSARVTSAVPTGARSGCSSSSSCSCSGSTGWVRVRVQPAAARPRALVHSHPRRRALRRGWRARSVRFGLGLQATCAWYATVTSEAEDVAEDQQTTVPSPAGKACTHTHAARACAAPRRGRLYSRPHQSRHCCSDLSETREGTACGASNLVDCGLR